MDISNTILDDTAEVAPAPSLADSPAINDLCPPWAAELIHKIYLLELDQGVIKKPPTGSWTTVREDELTKLASSLDEQQIRRSDDTAEELFIRVVRGLVTEGHSPTAISGFINARVETGCRLKYCNDSEILDALAVRTLN
jgi:hypothetical protein